MLVRLLFQSAAWFVISLTATLLAGPRLQRTHPALSIGWLVIVLGAGDAWALLTYSRWNEVLIFTAVALILGIVWIRLFRDWNALGQTAWMTSLLVTPLFLAYGFSVGFSIPLKPFSFLVVMTFFFFQFVTTILALTQMYENLEVTCRVNWRRKLTRIVPVPDFTPMVSLHLPTHDEPPEIVAGTLRALAALDYPSFEVLVVDNNTPEEKTWRPIEELCRELGPRFRFLHLENWPGYKSGALNFALTQTDPRAELIGIIDADYRANPEFLRETVPAFTDSNLAFIQAPQDYRDYVPGSWAEAIYYSYEYFFEVPMPVRNEHNAIIFSGTMGLIRKSVLQEIGGWDEWCITEDAEASLRVLKRGYDSVYYHHSMGQGLMPCTFAGLKRQRFRWCFGNIQILRKHWEALMPWARWVDPANRLTAVQRYYYLFGCLQWFSDAFNMAFLCFLLAGGVIKLLSADVTIAPVTAPLITLSAVFMALNIWRFGWVLRNALRISWGLAFRSMYGMFSVGWVVALASLRGLIQSRAAFLRTPKIKGDVPILNALFNTQWEAAIGVVCLAMGIAVLVLSDRTANTYLIGGLLIWQASIYLAAPVYSLFYKSCTE
jgi:cellulose synthase/poly-beta-1,6-N-acetylglucosamine synthase-like glycosyltransferase